MNKLDPIVHRLRSFRSLHKYIGVGLSLIVIITATTGILLGWKKNFHTLQPVMMPGTSDDLGTWTSFANVSAAALGAMDSLGIENSIDRLDVRPDKGIIKVLMKEGYWEVQVDGATGRVLSVAKRHADWIEHIHDGSIVNDVFKLGYTNILGIGLLTLSITGLYMWYGPRVIRRLKRRRQ